MGAGGLGNIAYRFGYQRYQTSVMYVVIVMILSLIHISWSGGWPP